MTTLANAIIYGNLNKVKEAIAAGEEPNQIDEYGFNPMCQAAIMRKLDIVKYLFSIGCHVDWSDTMGRTALHWAIDNHDMPFVEFLLDKGANPNSYTFASQPALTYPLLRNQLDLKNLLYQHGAKLTFAQDYTNTKLLGHRFSLKGETHIVNAVGDFILVDFEGFIFEFTASLIQDSLNRFINNYAAKRLQGLTKKVKKVVEIFKTSAALIKYQQFSLNLDEHQQDINNLLKDEIILIPIAYRGHAVTGVKYQDIFIKCDRGEYGRKHQTVTVYKIRQPEKFNKELIKDFLYTRNNENFVHYGLNDLVGLEEIYHIPLSPQITGNCSWANMEAAIVAILFILYIQEIKTINKKDLNEVSAICLKFFNSWQEWDQDRAIDECIQSFHRADTKRKATKVQVLTNITVHRCDYKNPHHVARAEKMLPILKTKEYKYIFNTFVKEFTRDKRNPVGQNLMHLLDIVSPTR